MNNVQPRGDRVLVEVDYKPEQIRPSGLVIPEGNKQAPQRGRILAVGPGRTLDTGEILPLDLAVGDVVIYAKNGGTDVEHDGDEKLKLFREMDVLAVVTND